LTRSTSSKPPKKVRQRLHHRTPSVKGDNEIKIVSDQNQQNDTPTAKALEASFSRTYKIDDQRQKNYPKDKFPGQYQVFEHKKPLSNQRRIWG
jgi:hypothetical protein